MINNNALLISMNICTYKLDDYCLEGENFLYLRQVLSSKNHGPIHDHNFVELFYIHEGGGIHIANNEKTELCPGGLFFIRSEDQHTLSPQGKNGMEISNLAFSKNELILFDQYPELQNRYFWSESTSPYSLQAPIEKQRELEFYLDRLAKSRQGTFSLHSFLFSLFSLLTPLNNSSQKSVETPTWMRKALKLIEQPEHFRGGVQAFVALCGRSHEHVSRTFKQIYGKSCIDHLNERRINYTCRQLLLSNAPIHLLAEECGFSNQSHFHKVFKKHMDCTPKEYQKQRQGLI
ncbi:MAG: helix-turn-helix domain-containing protein [Planctomycetes bacterium]|nr:helix-turn-helix domain-containing protein [Planctomycetota bacterium]